ncbi:polysaccharide pyruvyl transferase family protein [Alkalihalobacillus pseudalcaliphilus]|uniref:polysaccharide pyruvyl transferase family protein n=1 Tax=Alkalihalobacillus pseudalcaliphilus TaxID=79884 RepID=UPI00064DC5AD|nr:polysaccharide pyruvyl transferase family protein [Alkalihalobacillus pseudalcaliphilus]KMK75033.1 hypothetical protein AB990_16315 [Alkalihalobacillus pseudalcaliphilus]
MKVMMFAHHSSLNRGCEAIVRSSNQIIKQKIQGAKTYLVSEKPESDQLHTHLDAIYDGAKIPIRKYSLQWAMSWMYVKLFKDETYALRKIEHNTIKYIDEMDVFLSIGGDNYCYGEQPGWYEIDRRVKEKGKKLVLWACSIGEEDLSSRKLDDLKQFDLILARESLTYNTLQKHGLTNVKLCADPAFTMEKEEMPLPSGWQEGNTVGLNFSPLVLNKNPESKQAVKDLIEHILDTTTMTIALTPHVIQENNNDYEVLEEFYRDYKYSKRILLLSDQLNATQYKGYIARMRFFIGARTHATIAAYSNFVPTLVLGYSVKSKGIAKDLFGEEKFVLNLADISNSTKLKGSFNELYQQEHDIKQQLEVRIPEIKKLSLQAVDYLEQLIHGG